MMQFTKKNYADFADLCFFVIFKGEYSTPLDTYNRSDKASFLALRSSILDTLNSFQVEWWHSGKNDINTLTYMVFNRIDKHRIR